MLADSNAGSDVVTALIGLAGVAVGGFFAYLTSIHLVHLKEDREAQREREERQAVVRILQSELDDAELAAKTALRDRKWPPGWSKKAWSQSWMDNRKMLARAMDDDAFASVASAYLFMGLLETGLAAERDDPSFISTDESFMNDVSDRIQAARRTLDVFEAFEETDSSTSKDVPGGAASGRPGAGGLEAEDA